MNFLESLFGSRPALESTRLQEHERHVFEDARNMVLDELDTAVVDSHGRRFKEREIRTAKKTVMRL